MIAVSLGIKRQFTATYICALAALTVGFMVGWSAPTLQKLREPDSPLHLTSHQEGWVVSAMFVGQLLSPFPSGLSMHRFGPKRSLLILNALPVISWILIYFHTTASTLMVARLLGGLWYGASSTVVPIYTAEVSAPHVRAIFGSFYTINLFVGLNFVFILAPCITLKVMATICGVVSALFFVLFSYCPESPYFYVSRKDSESAAKTLNWLRGQESTQTELELQSIQISVEKEIRSQLKCLEEISILITEPANRKAFIICGMISVMDKFSGITCISSYALLFLPARVGPFTSNQWLVMINLIGLFALCIRAGLSRDFGNRSMLYISNFGISVSMFVIGVCFLRSKTVSDINWVPLAGILVFKCAYQIGMGPTVAILQGEMFPSNLKGQASALVTMISAFSDTMVTALFPVLSDFFGLYVNFFLYAANAFAALLFTRFYVIETKGKSLQLIQAELHGEEVVSMEKLGESAKLLSKPP